MDWPKGISNAHDLKKRDTGQPFFSQKEKNHRAGHCHQPCHHGKYQIRTHRDRAAHHGLHLFRFVLAGRQQRQHHRLDRSAQIADDQLRKLFSSVIISQHSLVVDPSDHQAVNIVVNRIKKGGAQKLPAKGKHCTKPGQAEQKLRLPAHSCKQEDHVTEIVSNLLPYQSPNAPSSAGQKNTGPA